MVSIDTLTCKVENITTHIRLLIFHIADTRNSAIFSVEYHFEFASTCGSYIIASAQISAICSQLTFRCLFKHTTLENIVVYAC